MLSQHVLIVEDSLVYRRLLSRMLTQWGYTVYEAENGVAALEILENQPVSLVISDKFREGTVSVIWFLPL
ncbi:hypothetical protein A9502_29580 [Klebsiella pneumoniae]|nr:hypothetical protein A9502_29580 [Klebsiella pneumoniae]